MAAQNTRELLLELLEEEAKKHEIDIVDVEIVGADNQPIVRVRIDHADETLAAISLDEVSAQNGWISELIESNANFEKSWMLEVSSPGLSRPLRRPHDFERFAGNRVAANFEPQGNRRRATGVLKGLVDGKVLITLDDGELAIPFDDMIRCVIKPDFSQL